MTEVLGASRGVTVNRQQLDVSISGHRAEEFWRVDVRHPVGSSAPGTALDSGDKLLSHLVRSAVAREGWAWESLAHWGRRRINRPGW